MQIQILSFNSLRSLFADLILIRLNFLFKELNVNKKGRNKIPAFFSINVLMNVIFTSYYSHLQLPITQIGFGHDGPEGQS
jgi:hypothetical protein